jgi:hypothetical protein
LEIDSALEAFAAISVGIAGFSAIVVALASKTAIYDARRLHWALGIIFGWSLGATVFSVLPYIFSAFEMPEAVVWRAGLMSMGIFTAIFGTFVLSGDRRLNLLGVSMKGRSHDTPRKRAREMTAAKYVYILTAMMLIAGSIWHAIPGYYLVGMTVMLMLSLWVLLTVFFLFGLQVAK